MKKFLNNLLDFIWPQFCLACKQEGSLCCGFCLNNILLEDISNISWPGQNDLYFDSCHICCSYDNELVQKLLKKYKYSYLENLADVLVDILEKQGRRLELPTHTIITNVPLHSRKKKQRGFDQTEILAKKLANRLDKQYSPVLKRRKYTKAQAQLSKQARQQNVANVFEATLQPTQDSTILLIDDVTTTGSTLNQAAKTLKKSGSKKVICLVIAKN